MQEPPVNPINMAHFNALRAIFVLTNKKPRIVEYIFTFSEQGGP